MKLNMMKLLYPIN